MCLSIKAAGNSSANIGPSLGIFDNGPPVIKIKAYLVRESHTNCTTNSNSKINLMKLLVIFELLG